MRGRCRSEPDDIDAVETQPARSKRGRPRSLTEEQIVDAAVDLARTVRFENVTMRALADELGVPVMTIYGYVANKDALSELVVNHTLKSVRVPERGDGTWEERLKQLERGARRAMSDLPGLSLDRRDSTEGRRLAEGVMAILDDAGFSPEEALLAFAALFTFMVGQIDVDIAGVGGPAAQAVQAAAQVTDRSRDDIFEFGFDALIEGLKAKLGPR